VLHAPSASLSFTRSLQGSGLATKAAAVLIGSLLIAAAAQVQVPMVPVPMTMQTFAVLTIGMLYGWRLGFATLVAYNLEALIGLPVYSGGANLAMLMAKPFTAGYLVGFVAAAVAAGWIVERRPGLIGSVLAVIAGSALIYGFGLPWLAAMMGGDIVKAVAVGAVPFLLGDLVKAVLAVTVREGLGRIRFGA
jgi:biotin transport system substrate-specific component